MSSGEHGVLRLLTLITQLSTIVYPPLLLQGDDTAKISKNLNLPGISSGLTGQKVERSLGRRYGNCPTVSQRQTCESHYFLRCDNLSSDDE